MEGYRRYGEVVRFDFLGFHGAVLHGAAANRYILVDNYENFLWGPVIDRARARWIVGEGLVFIDEPEHGQQRRLIMPAFHRQRFDDYQRIIRETTSRVLDRWQPGVKLDIATQMNELTLIVEGLTMFTLDMEGEARALGQAVFEVVYNMSDPLRVAFARLPFNLPGLGRGASLRRALIRIDTVLNEIIVRHEREGTDTGDVVSMLVAARDEEGGRLSASQVRDHLLTLFVAAHETVSDTLAWTFYLLAQHPVVTAKLLRELDQELHGEPPTAADLVRLPYLEQVVKESLRCYPPAASLLRIAREGFTWQGYHLPAGSLVVFSPFTSHHMPSQFPEPEVFRPERFDPAVGEPPSSYAFIPFGGGPRACMGASFAMMELKTVVAMVL